MKKLNRLINKIDTPVWLEVLFIIVFLIRIPTFFEPLWNMADVNILDLGINIRLFWIKVLLTVWNMLTVYFFWKLTVLLFPREKKVQKSATYTFAILTALPVFQTNVASLYFLVIGIVVAGLYFLFKKVNIVNVLKLSSFAFTVVLFIVSLAAIFMINSLSLSTTILIIPWAAIFVGLLLSSSKLEQLLSIIPLALVLAVFVFNKYAFVNPIEYYSNFGKLVTKQQSKESYFSYFGNTVNRNYEIANFINKSISEKESVFVFGGENKIIYAISKRPMPNLDIQNTSPTAIVILPEHKKDVDLLSLLTRQYMLISQIHGAQIWHIIRLK